MELFDKNVYINLFIFNSMYNINLKMYFII